MIFMTGFVGWIFWLLYKWCMRSFYDIRTRVDEAVCNLTIDSHYEHDRQWKRTKYTVPQENKGTSLHCYYVKMCRTGEYACDTCSTHFYIIAVKGCPFVYLRNCIFCPLSLSVMFIVSTVSHEAVSNENMHDLASLFYTTKLLDPCYLM